MPYANALCHDDNNNSLKALIGAKFPASTASPYPEELATFSSASQASGEVTCCKQAQHAGMVTQQGPRYQGAYVPMFLCCLAEPFS